MNPQNYPERYDPSDLVRVDEPTAIGIWQGAPQRGSSGFSAVTGYCGFSAYEICALPDFSSSRFPDLAELDASRRVSEVAARQRSFLAGLHATGYAGISLRYWFRADAEGRPSLRLIMVTRVIASSSEEAVARSQFTDQVIRSAFPTAYPLQRLSSGEMAALPAFTLEGASDIVEVTAPEQQIDSWHDHELSGFPYYYQTRSFEPAESDMIEFCRELTSSGTDLLLDVTLVPTTPLTQVERTEIGRWQSICDRWAREQRVELPGGLYSDGRTAEIAADPRAREMQKGYQSLLDRYGREASPYFLYAVRVIGWSGTPQAHIANAFATQTLAPGAGFRLLPYRLQHPAFERVPKSARCCYVTAAACDEAIWARDDRPETLRRLHRMADVAEISGFFRLPIPGAQGCPYIPTATGIESPGREVVRAEGEPIQQITIGTFLEEQSGIDTGEPAVIGIDELTRHGMVAGAPGSGKTNLCFGILAQLWKGAGVPFLVLEPAKAEYRELVRPLGDDLLVFTVGNERVSPFRFNPLEIPSGISLAEHISALNSCFAGAFPMAGPLPMLLDQALWETYLARGWDELSVGGDDPDLKSPTLGDLYDTAVDVVTSSSYTGETAGNIRGALESRIGSLLRGPKGLCFNAEESLPMAELLSRPVVLELDYMNEDEKALVMMLLLAAIREHVQVTRSSASNARTAHLLLVEEAHAVIGRSAAVAGADGPSSQDVAVRFFVRMLAEMRALGQGILVADQLPTAIASEVVKNTAIKFMHRIVSLEDREEMGSSMVFDATQIERSALLPRGVNFMFKEGFSRSRLVNVTNFKDAFDFSNPPSNEELAQIMSATLGRTGLRHAQGSELPYDRCSEVCAVCNPGVRQRCSAIVRATDRDARTTRSGYADAMLKALGETLGGELAQSPERFKKCLAIHFGDVIDRHVRESADSGATGVQRGPAGSDGSQ